MYTPARIQLKTVKMVESEPESDVQGRLIPNAYGSGAAWGRAADTTDTAVTAVTGGDAPAVAFSRRLHPVAQPAAVEQWQHALHGDRQQR